MRGPRARSRLGAPWAGGIAAALVLVAAPVQAQPPAGPPPAPRAAAPIDLTGQWVAIVNEDWRWRMVTPPPGDFASVPLTAEGRRLGLTWEPSQDGSCQAYGAAGLMRLPTRLRIEWAGDDVLVVETDAGVQTRRFHFDPSADPGRRSLQGHSVAEWSRPEPGPGRRPNTVPEGGHLKVTTTRLSGGWLRRNGAPYSEDAVLTEHFDRFQAPNGDEWLMVTAIVEDPRYLSRPFITSSHFRRESERDNWNPEPCDE